MVSFFIESVDGDTHEQNAPRMARAKAPLARAGDSVVTATVGIGTALLGLGLRFLVLGTTFWAALQLTRASFSVFSAAILPAERTSIELSSPPMPEAPPPMPA